MQADFAQLLPLIRQLESPDEFQREQATNYLKNQDQI